MIQKLKAQKYMALILLILILCSSCNGASPPAPATIESTPNPPPTSRPTLAPTIEASPTPGIKTNATTSGRVTEDEIWEGEISITGDIFLDSGVTLTIMPGTVVILAANSDDQQSGGGFDDAPTRDNNDPVRLEEWHKNVISINAVGGTIIAVGTPDQRITFTPSGDSKSTAQWDGIEIESGSIQYADVLYGGRVAINILGEATGVEIAHNEVRYFHWAGIDAHTADAWIHHNIIEGGGHQAVTCTSNSLIEHNIILASNTGIRCGGPEGYVVRNNLIIDTLLGISVNWSANEVEVYNNVMWDVEGPPDGFYYQGVLIYPPGFAGIGGIWTFSSSTTNIYNNIVSVPGGCGIGIHTAPAEGSIIDFNLLWGNESSFCAIDVSDYGSSNIVDDPMFVDVLDGDFRLSVGSPGIDAGNPSFSDSDGTSSDLGIFGGPFGNGW